MLMLSLNLCVFVGFMLKANGLTVMINYDDDKHTGKIEYLKTDTC
jgi:hypothetical protein